MRFHVVSLPHTQVTDAFSACAFTSKVRLFCIMMRRLGHDVFLYAGEHGGVPCNEHICCITEQQRVAAVGSGHYCEASFDPALPHWVNFNTAAAAAIRERAQPKDFVCIVGGAAQRSIAERVPRNVMVVEFGIGYGGTFAKYRVFESYAWMHTVYGSHNPNPNAIDGIWFDAVIPGYFDADDFPFCPEKDDYFLFIGRLIERKGAEIAADVCRRLGKRLIVAGQGQPPSYGEYIGIVGPEDRARLMSQAKAIFAPTIYIEPFGNVVPEAMLCGTPAITTDWGGFSETCLHGKTGYRCRVLSDFLDAVERVGDLNPYDIRSHALANYSLEAIAPKYDDYFTKLLTLWDDGWESTTIRRSSPEALAQLERLLGRQCGLWDTYVQER